VKPKQILDAAYQHTFNHEIEMSLSHLLNTEVFFNDRLRILTNHEVVVGSPEQLKGALSFLI